MRNGRTLALAGALLLGACDRPTSTAEVAQAWCDAIERHDEAAAEALMSDGLRSGVARLRQADAAFRTAHPGDKPPLGDGLRLTSFPDPVEACTTARIEGDVVVLRIVPEGVPGGAWEDRLHVRQGPGGPEIDDVGFAPAGAERLRAWMAAQDGP